MISPSPLLDLKGQDAEVAWRLAHGLDLQVGNSQCSGSTAETTMAQVGPWIVEQLGARGLGLALVHSTTEPATVDTFFFGNDRSLLMPLILNLTELFVSEISESQTWPFLAAIPISLGEYPIGALALSFDQPPPSPGAIVLLEVVGQELNNLFYEFRRARIRHHQVLELGKRLQNRVLEQAIDGAVAYIFEQTQLTAVLIAYWEDSQNDAPLCLRVYQPGQLIQSGRRGDCTPLGTLFQQCQQPTASDILQTLNWSGIPIGPVAIDIGFWNRDHQGLVISVWGCPLPSQPCGTFRTVRTIGQ